jgi:hypothetical protein
MLDGCRAPSTSTFFRDEPQKLMTSLRDGHDNNFTERTALLVHPEVLLGFGREFVEAHTLLRQRERDQLAVL